MVPMMHRNQIMCFIALISILSLTLTLTLTLTLGSLPDHTHDFCFICGTNWARFEVEAYGNPAGEVFIHSFIHSFIHI